MILASLCNYKPGLESGLMVIEEDLSGYRYVKPARMPICGVTGIAADERFIYAATQSKVIAIMDRKSLQLASYRVYNEIRDPHSVLLDGDRLLVVASGLNAVYECPLENGFVMGERPFWKSSEEDFGQDRDHLNSIMKYGDHILVSGFGRNDGSWASARSGYALDLQSGECVITGLMHPHTIMECEGRLIACESTRGAVVEISRNREVVLNGYTRGLCVGPLGLYAAISAGRKISRSTGLPNLEMEKKNFISGIYLLEPKTLEVRKFLEIQDREFYDLMLTGSEAKDWTYS